MAKMRPKMRPKKAKMRPKMERDTWMMRLKMRPKGKVWTQKKTHKNGGFWNEKSMDTEKKWRGAQKTPPLPRKMAIWARGRKRPFWKLARKRLRYACVHTCGPRSLLATPPTQNGHF